MKIYLYHADQTPVIERDYFAPGRYTMEHATISLSNTEWNHVEGDVVKFHVGHGVYRDYRVDAQGPNTALLIRV